MDGSPDTIVPDPGDPQALNRYSYVLNNPLRYTDPTGMFSEDKIMQYLGVSMWDDVLAMFGEGGVMARAWGFLEVLRQAELGTPISMWFDVGNGFNASQPNMMGMFSEQDGALVFSSAFLDWSGAGGTWTISGLSAVKASTMMPSTGQYQVGWSGGYIGAGSQIKHVGFDSTRVDWTSVGLGTAALGQDAGVAIGVAGAMTVNPALMLVGVSMIGVGVAAEATSVAYTYNQYRQGSATTVHLAVSVSSSVIGLAPGPVGIASGVGGILWDLHYGFRLTP